MLTEVDVDVFIISLIIRLAGCLHLTVERLEQLSQRALHLAVLCWLLLVYLPVMIGFAVSGLGECD